jgi:hypothetical protein
MIICAHRFGIESVMSVAQDEWLRTCVPLMTSVAIQCLKRLPQDVCAMIHLPSNVLESYELMNRVSMSP